MSLTYRQANAIVALSSNMAGAHLGACVTRPDRCTSMINVESSKRNRVAERELIEYLDELIVDVHTLNNQDEVLAWQDLLSVTGLLKRTK